MQRAAGLAGAPTKATMASLPFLISFVCASLKLPLEKPAAPQAVAQQRLASLKPSAHQLQCAGCGEDSSSLAARSAGRAPLQSRYQRRTTQQTPLNRCSHADV